MIQNSLMLCLCVREAGWGWEQPHKREHFIFPLGMQVEFRSSLGLTVESVDFKSSSHPNVGLTKVAV